MNRSLIAILCLTTTLGAVNFAGATDPQPPARTGVYQPARTLVEVSNDGHPLLVQYRVEKGADVNATGFFGRTALMEASSAGRLPVVQYLVNNGADVNAQDYSGSTALMAASYGHLPIVQHLLSRGADVNAETNTGRTALHVTRMRLGEQTIFGLLLGAMTDSGIKEEYPF